METQAQYNLCACGNKSLDPKIYLPTKAKRSIESIYLLMDHLATRESVDSFVQAKQLNFLVPERRHPIFFFFLNYTGNLFSEKVCQAPSGHSGYFLQGGKLLRYPSKLCSWQAH